MNNVIPAVTLAEGIILSAKQEATLNTAVAGIETSESHKEFLKVFHTGQFSNHRADLEYIELPEYACGSTEYYENLVEHNFRRPIGSMMRTVTPGDNNRRMIIIVGHTGNLVLFERHSGGKSGIVTHNVPDEYRHFIDGGALRPADVTRLTGGLFADNIVVAMTKLFKNFIATDFTGDKITRAGRDEE
jgi:hypothetical protein